MDKVKKLMKRSGTGPGDSSTTSPADTPEGVVEREVRAFCASKRLRSEETDDFIHLPAIVEGASSTPTAARTAATQIRKILAKSETIGGTYNAHSNKINACELIGILAINPGQQFTVALKDREFVEVVRNILHRSKDVEIQGVMRETLEGLKQKRGSDENLEPLLDMWEREKSRLTQRAPGQLNPDTYPGQARPSRSSHRSRTLPPADVLASILSEANGSAEILNQTLHTTPLQEFTKSELLPEFAYRCQQLSKELQQYMDAPQLPDEDTMLTMIDTNDKLTAALSRYRRDLIAARKAAEENHNQDGGAALNLLDQDDHTGGVSLSPPAAEGTSSPSPPPRGPNFAEPQAESQPSGFATYQMPELQTNNPFLMAAMRRRMETSAPPTATPAPLAQPSSFYDMNSSYPSTSSGQVPPPTLDNLFEPSVAGLSSAPPQQPLTQHTTHPPEWYEHGTADPFFNQTAPQNQNQNQQQQQQQHQPSTTAAAGGWNYYNPPTMPYQQQYRQGSQGQPFASNTFNTFNSGPSGFDVGGNQLQQHQQPAGHAPWIQGQAQPQEPRPQGQNQGSLID